MDIPQLKDYLTKFQFQKLFVEGLGWENPTGQTTGKITLNRDQNAFSKISEIGGVPVLKFNQKAFDGFKSSSKKFHKEIKKKYHKHLLLFSDEQSFFTLSYLSKEEQARTHSYFKEQSGDYFISKLAGIHFGLEDTPQIKEIGERLEKAFDTEKITKKFYMDFKANHFQFQKYISGIKNEEDKKWYASLILNRLMFIYFLQKKGFVNDDFNYLETKLKESKERGKDRYYSEFLALLFFEGFAKKPIERSPKAKNLLGKIKYLNGGLFVPHALEEKYAIKSGAYKTKIKIQDKAFEETFHIFSQYDWHLQGKQGQPDNEISPDVMGYIFEKYINELQQKSLGAYYTRDEITQYLSRSAIQKSVLEKVNQQGYEFQNLAELLHKLNAPLCKILLTNEDSILNNLTVLDPSVGSGAFLTAAMKELIDIYSPIIGKIKTLGDRELNQWLKDFESQHKSLAYGIKKSIILKNLYGVDIMKEATEVCKLRLFLSLVSSALDSSDLEPLPNLDFNILCGNSLIGFLREDEGEKAEKSSIDCHPHETSHPCETTLSHETSHSRESGNPEKSDHLKTKVGKQAHIPHKKQIAWSEILGEDYNQIKDKYNQLVSRYKNQPLSFAKLKELKKKTNQFLEENSKKLSRALADKCNREGVKYPEILDIQEKKKISKKRAVRPEDFYSKDIERNLNPFHWDFAFNEIMDKGGFDVIITNPPWEKVKTEDREFFYKYDSSIDKKKTKKELIKSKKKKLLKDTIIKKDYFKTEEFYLFQREYFSKLYQYQEGKITNSNGMEKLASADMDTYRLFTERAIELLNKNGCLGIVLPSGLCKDDGAIGLRKNLLFNRVKIGGLIDFQNQMEKGQGRIFEGVHPQFKFLLLNLQNAEPKDEFPCQFHERDLRVLDENSFPKRAKMTQSIKEIKKLSPRDCSIIEFKNSKDIKILKKVRQFPAIGKKLKNLWNPVFYTEFHETNDSHLFKYQQQSDKDLSLYKGEAIYQYEFNHNLSHVNRYVSRKSNKIQGKGFPFKNKCYKNYRLVIRTIASNTNERSLISAVIPKNHFISNSLYGVHIDKEFQERRAELKYSGNLDQKELTQTTQQRSKRAKNFPFNKISNKYMLLLQAFLNSFIVDYFIRQKVSANINKKFITPLCIPRLTERDPYFKELVERSAKLTCIGKEFNDLADEIGIPRGGVKDQETRWKIQGEIDAMVAYVYGLNFKEFDYILSTFMTGKNQVRLKALKEYALEAFEKDKFLDKAG